jgi:uncharacterized protein YcaQ
MTVVERLGSLQFDPLEVAGRNHDLVLLARVAGYRREWTDTLLYEDRLLFEAYNKGLSLLPSTELPWYRLTWDRHRVTHEAAAFREHAALVAELLERITRDGPLSATDVEPRAAIEWYWRPTNQVRALLEALAESGILGLARRDGNRRVYDLAERLFPEQLLAERRPERDQRRHRLLSRYRAHGLLGRSGSAELWLGTAPSVLPADSPPGTARRAELLEELIEAGSLFPVTIEGLRGDRFVLAEELPILTAAQEAVAEEAGGAALATGTPNGARPGATSVPRPGGADPGVAFLAPLDPLVWDRQFLRTLFKFEYVWEVYVPAIRRRWGYYVLPILFGDRLVGRIEPRIDRKAQTLRVLGLWWEDGFDPVAERGFVAAFSDALEAHRSFGGSARITFPRVARHATFVTAVREALEDSRQRGGPAPMTRRPANRRAAVSP